MQLYLRVCAYVYMYTYRRVFFVHFIYVNICTYRYVYMCICFCMYVGYVHANMAMHTRRFSYGNVNMCMLVDVSM